MNSFSCCKSTSDSSSLSPLQCEWSKSECSIGVHVSLSTKCCFLVNVCRHLKLPLSYEYAARHCRKMQCEPRISSQTSLQSPVLCHSCCVQDHLLSSSWQAPLSVSQNCVQPQHSQTLHSLPLHSCTTCSKHDRRVTCYVTIPE